MTDEEWARATGCAPAGCGRLRLDETCCFWFRRRAWLQTRSCVLRLYVDANEGGGRGRGRQRLNQTCLLRSGACNVSAML